MYTLRQGDPSGPCGDHDHRVCGQNPPQGLQHRLQGLLLRCRTLPRGHLPVGHVRDHQVGPHRTGQLEHVREHDLVWKITTPCRQPFGKFPGRFCALHEGRSTEVTRRATQFLLPSHQPLGGQQFRVACGQCDRVVVHVRGTHVLQPIPVQQPQHGHQIAAPATRVPQPYPRPASVLGVRQRPLEQLARQSHGKPRKPGCGPQNLSACQCRVVGPLDGVPVIHDQPLCLDPLQHRRPGVLGHRAFSCGPDGI